jgi:ADP-heptose:LPS heptosyltransferase/O-antigen/teichoic acid export membrane protein/thymidylate kinase
MIGSKYRGANAPLAAQALARRWRTDSLLRNSVYIMTTTALTASTGYIFWIVAARMYPAEDVGLASALVGVMMLSAIMANLGIGPTLIQILPRRESGSAWSLALNAIVVSSLGLSLLTGTIAALLLPVLSPRLAVVGHQSGFTLALIAGVPLITVAAVFDSLFTAERVAGNMLTRTATFAVLRIPLLIAPIALGFAGALAICSAWVIAAGCGVAAGVLLTPRLKRGYRFKTRGLLAQIISMRSMIAGHQLISLGALAPIYLLPVIVVTRLSLAENAYFYTTWQVGSLFFMVSPAVASSLLAEGSHTPADILRKARSGVLIILGLLVAPMLIAALGGRLILGMFGANYALYGYGLLIVLVASAIPDAITNVYVSVLRVQKRYIWGAALNLGMATTALALAWALLPRLGIAGAGWAWLIAQTAGTVVVLIDLALAAGRRGDSAGSAQAAQRAERILLIVDPASAGESLRLAPYVRMIRRSEPQAVITLVGNGDTLKALERVDDIDRTIRSELYRYRPYPVPIARLLQAVSWIQLAARVGGGYDRVITFYWGSALQHGLAYLGSGRRGRRVGYATYPAFLARRLLTTYLGAFRWKESHPPQHAELLRAAGISVAGEALPAVTVSEVDATAVTLLLQEHLADEGAPLITLHPGSDWACQQWLRERWAELADALAARYAATIVFTGTANETEYVRAIQKRMVAPSISFTGQTTLGQMAALLTRSALCVCVDSAIFELTQATGAPAVVLAGPSRPDTGLFGSFQPTIVRRMDDGLAVRVSACQTSHNANHELGCWNYECPMSGLREISVADALQAVEETMEQGASARPRLGAGERESDMVSPAPHPLLVDLFTAFSRENIRWLLMRGEHELASPEGDVDLLIDPHDMPRARAILESRRFLSWPTLGRGTHHFFVGYDPASPTWVKLDIVTELTFGPYLSLKSYAAAGVLARRRRLDPLFVPSQDDAFWMLLLHCALDKGRFAPHRAARLAELAAGARTDSPLARQVALSCPAGWDPARLVASAARGDWPELTRLAPVLRAGFQRREPVATRGRAVGNRVLQALEIPMIRLGRPGVTVALLGPDGAGKSFLATEITRSFYVPVRVVYMGLWKSGPRSAGAKGQSPAMRLAGQGLAIAGRLPKAWSRYLLGQYHRALGRVVIYDRYTYDALVAARQPGGWVKRTYMWVLGHGCPAPDLTLVLDAPGAVMYARKGENSPEELEVQRQGLLALCDLAPRAQVVDVTRAPVVVRADALNRIWSAYRDRRSPAPGNYRLAAPAAIAPGDMTR